MKLFFIAGGIWTLLAFITLILGIPQGEARMTAFILMMILGFPSNLFFSDALVRHFPEIGETFYSVHGPIWGYVLGWFVLYLTGALQWFVIPYLVWRKWFATKI